MTFQIKRWQTYANRVKFLSGVRHLSDWRYVLKIVFLVCIFSTVREEDCYNCYGKRGVNYTIQWVTTYRHIRYLEVKVQGHKVTLVRFWLYGRCITIVLLVRKLSKLWEVVLCGEKCVNNTLNEWQHTDIFGGESSRSFCLAIYM